MNLTKVSKRMSYLLRHASADEITLNEQGFAAVKELLPILKIDFETLCQIVHEDNKQRYQFDPFNTHIRAVQGHSSSQVNLLFPTATPPSVLYHGTPTYNVDSIMKSGLHSGERQYVHLSADVETAKNVGLRGADKAAILAVDAETMFDDGILLHIAENGVWLVRDVVDPSYLSVHEYCSK